MTVKEAAEETRMSQSWWRQKIHRGEVDYLKMGRSVRIPISVVEDLMQRAEIKARRRVP